MRTVETMSEFEIFVTASLFLSFGNLYLMPTARKQVLSLWRPLGFLTKHRVLEYQRIQQSWC